MVGAVFCLMGFRKLLVKSVSKGQLLNCFRTTSSNYSIMTLREKCLQGSLGKARTVFRDIQVFPELLRLRASQLCPSSSVWKIYQIFRTMHEGRAVYNLAFPRGNGTTILCSHC